MISQKHGWLPIGLFLFAVLIAIFSITQPANAGKKIDMSPEPGHGTPPNKEPDLLLSEAYLSQFKPSTPQPFAAACPACAGLAAEANAIQQEIEATKAVILESLLKFNEIMNEAQRLEELAAKMNDKAKTQLRSHGADDTYHKQGDEASRLSQKSGILYNRALNNHSGYIKGSKGSEALNKLDALREKLADILDKLSQCEDKNCGGKVDLPTGEPEPLRPMTQPCPACKGLVNQYNDKIEELYNEQLKLQKALNRFNELIPKIKKRFRKGERPSSSDSLQNSVNERNRLRDETIPKLKRNIERILREIKALEAAIDACEKQCAEKDRIEKEKSNKRHMLPSPTSSNLPPPPDFEFIFTIGSRADCTYSPTQNCRNTLGMPASADPFNLFLDGNGIGALPSQPLPLQCGGVDLLAGPNGGITDLSFTDDLPGGPAGLGLPPLSQTGNPAGSITDLSFTDELPGGSLPLCPDVNLSNDFLIIFGNTPPPPSGQDCRFSGPADDTGFADPALIFSDGFESGDTSAWSSKNEHNDTAPGQWLDNILDQVNPIPKAIAAKKPKGKTINLTTPESKGYIYKIKVNRKQKNWNDPARYLKPSLVNFVARKWAVGNILYVSIHIPQYNKKKRRPR